MQSQNFSATELKPEEKKLIEKMKSTEQKGGSITYSAQGAANYVKVVQEGKILELLKSIDK